MGPVERDTAGRRVWSEERPVATCEPGALAWPSRQTSGVLLYRLSLTGDDGVQRRVSGKLILAR